MGFDIGAFVDSMSFGSSLASASEAMSSPLFLLVGFIFAKAVIEGLLTNSKRAVRGNGRSSSSETDYYILDDKSDRYYRRKRQLHNERS